MIVVQDKTKPKKLFWITVDVITNLYASHKTDWRFKNKNTRVYYDDVILLVLNRVCDTTMTATNEHYRRAGVTSFQDVQPQSRVVKPRRRRVIKLKLPEWFVSSGDVQKHTTTTTTHATGLVKRVFPPTRNTKFSKKRVGHLSNYDRVIMLQEKWFQPPRKSANIIVLDDPGEKRATSHKKKMLKRNKQLDQVGLKIYIMDKTKQTGTIRGINTVRKRWIFISSSWKCKQVSLYIISRWVKRDIWSITNGELMLKENYLSMLII